MGFKDFITNLGYRKRTEARFARMESLQPPKNPSPRYIKRLVKRLLDEYEADLSSKELAMIGQPIIPMVLDALQDPRYINASEKRETLGTDPMGLLLGLLVPLAPEKALHAAARHCDSAHAEMRQTAGRNLLSTGLEQAIPYLKKLLQDPEHYVRAHTCHGIGYAVSEGRATDGFRAGAYALLIEQCDESWEIAGNDSVRVLIHLDPKQAEKDLSTERFLSLSNPNLSELLCAFRASGLRLPTGPLEAIFDKALRQCQGKNPYPNQYIAGEALQLLGKQLGQQSKPMIERAMENSNAVVQEAAAQALTRAAGIDDPMVAVFDRLKEVGYENLTGPQRLLYCAHLFDAEVCNGGLMQFFGNSSGDHAVDTLEALKQLDHPEAIAALSGAMQAVGPLSREADRDMRLQAFEGRYEELDKVFSPLESAYYKTKSALRVKMSLYAAEHAEDFR